MNSNNKLAQEWFNVAEDDYRYALIGSKEEYIYPQVGFSSQQCVEKILKGLLVLKEIEPSKIHDLQKLYKEVVKYFPKLEGIKEECKLLNSFYIESRYPPDIPDYTKEDILKTLHAAEKVRDYFHNTILKHK